jgi:DNA-binding MarR family transcriptional regulator
MPMLAASDASDSAAAQLADGLSRAKQEVSRLVDTLVDREYVVRESDPDDRRRLVLRLTRKGRAAADVIQAAVLALDQRMEAELAGCGLDADQIERVGRALDQFAGR